MRAAALESLEYRLERENLAEPIPDEPCSLWKLTFPDHLPLSLTKTLISARSSVKKTAPSPIPLFWYLDISGYSRGNGLKRISSRRDERRRERERIREKEERSLIFQRPPLGGGYLTIGTLHGDWIIVELNGREIVREIVSHCERSGCNWTAIIMPRLFFFFFFPLQIDTPQGTEEWSGEKRRKIRSIDGSLLSFESPWRRFVSQKY